MKKTLLTMATMVAGILSMNAQCTPVQSCTPTAGYCATPAANSTLTAASSGAVYSSDIQFSLGTTVGSYPISGATITAVSGLPSGISVSYNPTSGVVPAGTNACLHLSGTTTAATGIYTMTATFHVGILGSYTVVPAQWYLPLNASTTGINAIANTSNGVLVLAPNPAKSELTITSDVHLTKATIIDALGKVVMVQELNYANQAVIDVRNLERGVYFLQANDGSKIMTKKFIKD